MKKIYEIDNQPTKIKIMKNRRKKWIIPLAAFFCQQPNITKYSLLYQACV